ncbi:LysR family transcriptional regulator [Hydrogenophaga sp.]|uniref:LysR family transcriptional regulator n=1 Tax=Hydrogenophaga sp. TaxID=1904254 RepID=UPI002FC83831
MDLKQLGYFVEVCETGSFSKAGVRLNLAQPSVSRQVALLEAELGQRLLERNGRGVQPTEAGHALLTHARVMLASAMQARYEIREMKSEPAGKVIIGLPHRVAAGICVPLVRRFRERLPHAILTIVEGLSLSLREGVIAGRIDVGLLFDPAPTPLLKYENLLRERLVLVTPPGFRLPAQVSLSSLRDFSLVLPASPNPIRSLVDAVLLPRKVHLNVIAEVGAVQTALKLVESGLACSILPESAMLLSDKNAKVHQAPIGPPAMWNQLVLAMPTARPMNRLTQETTKLLRELDFRVAG